MGKIITVANQKGGVAKTTTAVSLAAGLKMRGYKVLAVDLDAQANMSDNVGYDDEKDSIYEVLKGESTAEKAVQKTAPFDLICSSVALIGADGEFTGDGRELLLKKALKKVKSKYDYIIIDTPPALGILTTNAFMASDELVIPMSGTNSLKGLNILSQIIQTIAENGNPGLKVNGILQTMYNPRANIDQNIKAVAEAIAEQMNTRVYKTYIRSSVSVNESVAASQDIFTYSSKNNVALDYSSFIDEFLEAENNG